MVGCRFGLITMLSHLIYELGPGEREGGWQPISIESVYAMLKTYLDVDRSAQGKEQETSQQGSLH
jgi:hypothetical protein